MNIPNQDGIDNNWKAYQLSVDELEQLTGYDFLSNVNPSIQRVIESRVDNENGEMNSPAPAPTRTQRQVNSIAPSQSRNNKQAKGCDPAYPNVCIAPPPPDLNCPDVERKNGVAESR